MAELGGEFLLDSLDELVVKLFLDKVDGATAKAATHDAGSCHVALPGEFVQEIELGAADLVELAHSKMGLIHHLSNGLIVTSLKGVADIQNPLDLTDDIFSPQEILLGNLLADFLQPNSLGVGQEVNLRMVLLDRGGGILARLAALVVR